LPFILRDFFGAKMADAAIVWDVRALARQALSSHTTTLFAL
jgi:hypothetical protein